ncbi:MAG: UDP-3-O-(3-hydroxymyristoyl)glucosamine N-acyltransferase [Desulfuromonadales bacterium]|nr:UDP-3-O-(3-hydroxymyristoyl)glucosamine N-acyltransferase [Desulfuromonadales bacterium]NIS43331.1 UDP-3-O-(3-hydroxymyristoyl)glucosamine N-acyltransferase [Desulfuromonadales bacterium]
MATLKELADLVGGEVQGDADIEIRSLATLDDAGEGDITFLANPKYQSKLETTQASAVIVAPGTSSAGKALLVTQNPYLAFAKVLSHLHVRRPTPQGVMEGAVVSPDAVLGDGVTVYPGCFVGPGATIGNGTILHPGVTLYEGVSIGDDALLHAGVVVREGCRIGNRVIIHANAVIGSDGFGFAPDGSSYYKIPQIGIVVVEDDVEIGSASCIDRAALEVTRIKRGAKIDNLVQIGHNCTIGEDTVIVSQVGIAGSTEVGDHCTLGGQAGVAGHIKIGDNVTVGGQSAVSKSVKPNQAVSGYPLMPHREWLKSTMSYAKLPEMRKEVNRLKERLAELESALKEK